MTAWLASLPRVLALAVLALLALAILLFFGLLIQRALASLVAAHAARRRAVLAPAVHRALEDPAADFRLSSGWRAFDRRVLRDLLLHLAQDLRGAELEEIAGLYGRLGLLDVEFRRLRRGRARQRATAALNLGTLQARPALPALLGALHDRDPRVRLAVIRAVGEIGAREALVVLIPLLGDANPVVRRRVEEILARQGREVGREITAYLETTSTRAGRRAAVDLLGWLRVPEAADLLLELLEDPDLEIRVKAAKAAGGVGDPRFLDVLHRCLDDPAWEVRCQAARALTTLGSATSVPRLRAALRDRHWWVRFYAASALGELGMAGLAALRDALEDPVPAARDMARYLLDRTGGVPALP